MDNHLWLLLHLLALCTTPVFGKVFMSIDCGSSGSFTDQNSIEWQGDDGLIATGVTHVVQSNHSVSRVMDTLRVFTTRKKNCYSMQVEVGEKVLVRAGFNYGNYDRKSTPPMFDLLFDGNVWTTVNSSVWKMYEAIYVAQKKVTSVCVAQTNPNQFPFISSLEIRSLDSQMYNHIGANYALFSNLRTAYAINETIRFPKDPYDRMWEPAVLSFDNSLVNLTNAAATLNNVDAQNSPPPEILENAIATPNISRIITLAFTITDYLIRYPVYINWYFTEVKELNSTEYRSFRIYKDSVPFSLPIVPRFGNVTEYYVTNLTHTPETNFSIESIGGSTLPPLLNECEVFSISDPLTGGTNNNDVEGLDSLQTAFGVLQEWGGDPCLPAAYSWEWIECSNEPTPRVTSINLSSFNLSGPLPNFSSMDALEIIDLHNNSLTGSVPDFLGTLPKLKQLNLANNRFSGSIPRSLSKNSEINLSDTGNPLLCTNGKACPGGDNKTSELPIILGISIPLFFIFGAIACVLVIRRKRGKASVPPHSGDTSHRANGTSGTRGTTRTGNFDENYDVESKENMDELFYRSPAPLLG